jgi:hypothetical protein
LRPRVDGWLSIEEYFERLRCLLGFTHVRWMVLVAAARAWIVEDLRAKEKMVPADCAPNMTAEKVTKNWNMEYS